MPILHKIVLAPDSFKGTMSSAEVCSIMAEQVRLHMPGAQTVSIPVADGGEGTVDAFLAAMPGEKVFLPVRGPYGEEVRGFYGLLDGGETAVVETAACAGLTLVGENRRAEKTTTYGVGQLIAGAAESGCEKIIVGLGGSATNDGGAGAACALGARFLDAAGRPFVPVGETLGSVETIDLSGLCPALRRVRLVAMCDIDNPLCGPRGAAAVFGPQKGADARTVRLLDRNLAHFAAVIRRDLGRDVLKIPGAGAAGGMGAGMAALLGAELCPGIRTVLDAVHFDSRASGADLIFTGEGRLDAQSLQGKVISGVAARAGRLGVPLVAVVGGIGDGIGPIYDMGVSAVFSINRLPVDFSIAKAGSRENLAAAMENILRLIAAF